MSWKIKEKYRRVLAAESGAVVKNHGGKLAVCLVYPNRYRVAMGNLGFHAVYALLNSYADVVCERAFLPDPEDLAEYRKTGTPLLSLETQCPVANFDMIAFSVSFESDYINVPSIFRLAGLNPRAVERTSAAPLILAGGAALFLNPEPVAELMDVIAVGEAEQLLPPLLAVLKTGESRDELLLEAASLPGVYVPSFFQVRYEGPGIMAFTGRDGTTASVARVWDTDLSRTPTSSVILAPEVEFSEMFLVELSRGCPRGCRFCAAGFIYLPYRQRDLEQLKAEVSRGLSERQRIGLVGAAISDHKGIGELCRHIIDQGGKLSVSSLRLDALDEDMIGMLRVSGHKSIALAPEGGSQRLRDLMKKDLTEEQILAACDRLIGKDILNLKLYFIIGLPGETDRDMEELVSLVEKIRERVIAAARANKRLGEVVLSVNPFIPKPFTPFQWCGMEDVKSLEGKVKFLEKGVGRLSNVRLQMESPRAAYLQALLSRGDRRLAALLIKGEELGGWRKGAKAIGLDTDAFVYRQIPLEETLPWDFIIHDKKRLVKEYLTAFSSETLQNS